MRYRVATAGSDLLRNRLENQMDSHERLLDRAFGALIPFYQGIVQRPWPVVAVTIFLTLLGLLGASRLQVDSDFSKLIPSDYSSVKALERLRESVGGESEAAVVIESPSFDANVQLANALIPPALELTDETYPEPFFTHVEFRRETSFLENNALYFATEQELDSLTTYLDRVLEEAQLEANPFYFELDDETDGRDSLGKALIEDYRRLIGDEYPISNDSTVLVLKLFPSGAQTDIDFIRHAYASLGELVQSLDPASYHKDMEITLAGRLLRQKIQVEAITSDVEDTFLRGAVLLLLIVVGYFFYKGLAIRTSDRVQFTTVARELVRAPAIAALIAVPLIAAEACTFGLAYMVYGTLNIMTSTLGLVLFGLGIDFGIHVYARYAEERGRAQPIASAIQTTIQTTGKAVTVVAVTTAAAFFILMIADFKGFSEFGFIAGSGIMLGLLAMIVVLPALLVLFERLGLINLSRASAPQVQTIAKTDSRSTVLATVVVTIATIAIALSIALTPGVSFEYDFGKLEPVYEEYNQLNRKVRLVYSDRRTRNAAYVLLDTPEEVEAVATAVRAHAAVDTLTPTIRLVETLQDRFPFSESAATRKLDRIAAIRSLLDDPTIESSDDEGLQLLKRAASTTERISIDDVPEFLKRPFTTKQGSIGHVVIIYPSVSLSDGRNSMRFSDDVGTIVTADGREFHAGSTPIVAADMLRLMQKEAPIMVVLTLLLIISFKFLILGRPGPVLLALVPLVAGFFWMFGLMEVTGLRLTFYNLVVLPTVLGIGDDSGIHMVHRYLEEGRGSLRRVVGSTGEHVAVSALTTMFGFAGLLTSMHPGMRSIGTMAVVGIGMTLVAALVLLPAVLYLLERRRRNARGHVV